LGGIHLLIFIEGVFTLISFVLLTAGWIFIVSLISYIISMILRENNIRPNPFIFSILLGIAMEVILSAVSIIMSMQSSGPDSVNTGVLSGFEKGYGFTALLSPLSSIVGAIIGIKKRRGSRRFF